MSRKTSIQDQLDHPSLTTAVLCACQFLNQVDLDPESRPGEHRALMVRAVKAMMDCIVQESSTTVVDAGGDVIYVSSQD